MLKRGLRGDPEVDAPRDVLGRAVKLVEQGRAHDGHVPPPRAATTFARPGGPGGYRRGAGDTTL